MTMLEVRNLSVTYGQHRALEDVSLRVNPGEIVVILGANGAGKSTLLRAISGICEGHRTGEIDMSGHPILGLPSNRIVGHGIALVPEGRGIFGDLSVIENLRLGAYGEQARDEEEANLRRVLSLFPKLEERKSQIARTMSGGEQQMVAIGRAMMSSPKILMLDEPSLGLSPLLCKELFANLKSVKASGIGILLVEQNARQSLAIADRGYLLENARIIHEDKAANLMTDPAVQKAYLGAAAKPQQPAISAPPSAAPPHQAPLSGPSPNDIAAAALASLNRPSEAKASKATPAAPAPAAPSSVAPSRPASYVALGGVRPRQNADTLAGISIAEIVGKASQQASQTPQSSAPQERQTQTPVYIAPPPAEASKDRKPKPATPRPRASIFTHDSHEDRLRAALDEIETAAKAARNRARPRTRR
jgi:branched-chain amino acid transport system ATP-binding protein